MQRRSFLGYALMFLAGCSASQSNKSPNANSNFPNPLRFTITDAITAELLEEYQPFRQKLTDLIETEIQFVPVESYTAAAISLQEGEVDLALTGPAEYVAIRARTNAVPIVTLSRPDYYSIIVKTAQSEIKSLTDLKGKTISMGPVGSTSSYLGPTYLLVKAGLNPKTDVEIKNLDEAGLEALIAGEVAVWCGSLTDYQSFLEARNLQPEDLPIVAKSQPLPSDVFVVSSQLEPTAIAKLSEIMFSEEKTLIQALENVDDGKYQKAQFGVAQDRDYDLIRDAYKAVGEGNFV